MINFNCNSFFECDHYQKVGNCDGCGNQYNQAKPKRPMTRTPDIKKVIFNDPATIVYWNDGTKTVVKCQEGDVFDPEKGLAMAISKKYFGNKGNYCEVFKKWVPEEKEEKSRTIIGKVAHFDKTEDGIYATIEANCNIDGYKLFKTLQESEARGMSISFDVKEKK